VQKLRLEALTVDGFATTATAPGLRGTVAGHATGQCSAVYGCNESQGGTCWISCLDTCQCETAVDICG
jgi:hypothetical protein